MSANFLTLLAFQALLPTLPIYVSQHSGSSSDIGLIVGLFSISALLIRPFTGVALDTLGRKKLLFIGVFICLVAIGSYYWTTSITMILLIRIIHGVGWGISSSAYATIASDLVPSTRRGEGLGYFGIAFVLSGALGPLLGILLINSYGSSMLFAFSAIITFLSLVLLLLITEPTLEVATITKHSSSLLSKLIEKTSILPSFFMLILGMIFGGIISFITLYGTEVGIENMGWFFLVNALGSFLVRPFSGRLFDKKGHLYVILPSVLFVFVGVILLSYVSSILNLMVAALFYGIGVGALQPALQAWTINRAASNRRGVANATFYSAFDVGIGGGAMLLGVVARMTNYAFMYRLSSLSIIILLVVYLVYFLQQRKNVRYSSANNSLT